jgi:hypothetical protein
MPRHESDIGVRRAEAAMPGLRARATVPAMEIADRDAGCAGFRVTAGRPGTGPGAGMVTIPARHGDGVLRITLLQRAEARQEEHRIEVKAA